MNSQEFITLSANDTFEVGREFAKNLKQGDVVSFYGDLGAGKTEFIKGICNYFGVEDLVTSPTFKIINKYHASTSHLEFPIYHIDLYRIKSKDDFSEIGFQECIFSSDSLKLVEWSENDIDILPDNRYKVDITNDRENELARVIKIDYLEQLLVE